MSEVEKKECSRCVYKEDPSMCPDDCAVMDRYKKLYEVIRDWESQGFITVHQWRNFADYIDILLRKERHKTAERIFKELEKCKHRKNSDLFGELIFINPVCVEKLKKEFLGGGKIE